MYEFPSWSMGTRKKTRKNDVLSTFSLRGGLEYNIKSYKENENVKKTHS